FERPLLGYLSHPEIQAILNAPPATTASGRRDRILFELMYNTGARVSEIAALNRQDIQRSWELGELVHGFGIEQEETE
ncbi:MAG: tyrosine-type recombinase/integrase, partial [Verrucomicrobiota bacterium]